MRSEPNVGDGADALRRAAAEGVHVDTFEVLQLQPAQLHLHVSAAQARVDARKLLGGGGEHVLHGERRVDVGLERHARHDAEHAIAADDRAEELSALGRRGVTGARVNAPVPADELDGHHALGHAKVGGDAVRVDTDRAAHREGRVRLHRARRAAVLVKVKQHV